MGAVRSGGEADLQQAVDAMLTGMARPGADARAVLEFRLGSPLPRPGGLTRATVLGELGPPQTASARRVLSSDQSVPRLALQKRSV